ncbi:putative proline dehydrogenase 2 [Orchesella cincta]|uniref:Proline dehydrogenase n=1 Tax=Orchesella cincta TaxID=48709 RepID=A0A1D2N008_ORCCI|nr:putative proline dehydrogenase 2 [Orchesella cincta]
MEIMYTDLDGGDYRKKIAPWLKFGEYQKGLLSHLSTYEIMRALFVLHLCSFDVIVDKSTQLLSMSSRFGKLSEILIRKTFYDQFVGGEETDRMKLVVDTLHRRGLTLMVAPVLEEDVEDEKSSKDVYDENVTTLKGLANMTSSMDKEKPIVQLKVSAIMPAKTLEQINRALESKWNSSSSLAKIVEEMCSTPPKSWTFLPGVSKEDKEHFINGIRRSDEFVCLARDLGVKILVDAEFYSCKLAISTIALMLMARYNTKEYVVGDTIQGYLKDAHDTILKELEVTKNLLGVNWYGKIVRGAYMDRERYLAAKKQAPSPICDSYEATSDSYNQCIQTVLHFLADNKSQKSHLLIATHNEKSIRFAVQTLKNLGIASEDGLSSFAQIYGMADYLSTPLVGAGYKVYKSTPYGPLAKVVPYLARRASENRSVLKGAREERIMLKKELLARIF